MDVMLAWLAGVFEGEGSVGIRSNGCDPPSLLVCVDVTNTDLEMVAPLHVRWGGRLRHRQHTGNRRPYWHWNAYGDTAVTFLNDLLPYLHTSRVRTKALLAIQFQTERAAGGTRITDEERAQRHDAYIRMRALNHRGLGE